MSSFWNLLECFLSSQELMNSFLAVHRLLLLVFCHDVKQYLWLSCPNLIASEWGPVIQLSPAPWRISTSDCLSEHPLMCMSYCSGGCAFLCDVSTCMRQYKPCRPTMLLWLSVYVRVGMRLCVHVWSSSPWQLYPAWHGPIKILLAAREGIARRAVLANAAATHTLYTASTGRYDSKHLQSSMKPRTAKEERGGLLMYG